MIKKIIGCGIIGETAGLPEGIAAIPGEINRRKTGPWKGVVLSKSMVRIAGVVFAMAMAASVTLSGCLSISSGTENKSDNMNGVYTGSGNRMETNCLAGECSSCPAQDEVKLTRSHEKIEISTRGDCLSFTPCAARNVGTSCGYTFEGSYAMTDEGIYTFAVDTCNGGTFPASGGGMIEGKKITASFSCDSGEINSSEWTNVVLTKAD